MTAKFDDRRNRETIAFVVTIPGAARAFLMAPIRALSEKYDVLLLSNFADDKADDLLAMVPGGRFRLVNIPFARKPSLWNDIRSWWALFRYLRRTKPDILHSLMPKTGLLAMTGGLAAGIPTRAHMFTGQVWATRTGWQRTALKMFDRIISASATTLLADSPSQREFLIENRIAREIEVLGHGSVGGVDIEKFRKDPVSSKAIRAQLGIDDDILIFGFLGRLNHDKGVTDLVAAFAAARPAKPAALLLVGPDEAGIADQVRVRWSDLVSKIHIPGSTDQPERWLAAFDICCLPSYREGFGTTIIEAAACGVPALASRIYGLTDAIDEGRTGLLHPPADIQAISSGIETLAADTRLREQLGTAARQRVERQFSQAFMVERWLEFYDRRAGRRR